MLEASNGVVERGGVGLIQSTRGDDASVEVRNCLKQGRRAGNAADGLGGDRHAASVWESCVIAHPSLDGGALDGQEDWVEGSIAPNLSRG